VFDGFAHPHSSMPYVQMGFRIALYMNTLLMKILIPSFLLGKPCYYSVRLSANVSSLKLICVLFHVVKIVSYSRIENIRGTNAENAAVLR
jgi:hypothetical protein